MVTRDYLVTFIAYFSGVVADVDAWIDTGLKLRNINTSAL